MATTQAILRGKDTTAQGELYSSFELGDKKWQMSLCDSRRCVSRYTVAAGDTAAVADCIVKAAARLRTGSKAQVHSCYEAGRDGWWLHRWLSDMSVTNYEVDASSIEVSRRARRAKTDRIDLAQLMRAFLAYLRGEPGVCSMVRVPTLEEEDRKRRTRARDRLVQERTAHTNRIKGLLHGQGIRDAMPLNNSSATSLT